MVTTRWPAGSTPRWASPRRASSWARTCSSAAAALVPGGQAGERRAQLTPVAEIRPLPRRLAVDPPVLQGGRRRGQGHDHLVAERVRIVDRRDEDGLTPGDQPPPEVAELGVARPPEQQV